VATTVSALSPVVIRLMYLASAVSGASTVVLVLDTLLLDIHVEWTAYSSTNEY